jgi:uncharacterized membrane protein YeaQ/YmgE (transglycosylase-associated protein family)
MDIIGFILFGLVVGAIAKFVIPGRDPGDLFATSMIGMLGALVGGLVGRYVLGASRDVRAGVDHVDRGSAGPAGALPRVRTAPDAVTEGDL